MTTLNISSIPNEYYLGDLPGTLQYSKDPNEIINLQIEDINTDYNEYMLQLDNCGFILTEHSSINYRRIVPDTVTGRGIKNNSRILLIMKREEQDGTIWLKAALQNKNTGLISLLTSTNNEAKLPRSLKTEHPEWFVGHYRMCAPMAFWRELRNRLLY